MQTESIELDLLRYVNVLSNKELLIAAYSNLGFFLHKVLTKYLD